MLLTFKHSVTATLLSLLFLTSSYTYAQTLAKNTDWLQRQLNKLVVDDDDHNLNVNGKKSTPAFDFKGCQMNMNFDSKDEDVSIGMNIAWQLKDVRKVSYKREKDGHYTLVLDVPADKIKMNMGLGGFSGSFNMDDKDSKSEKANSSFSLSTKDEALMREIKQKLDDSVEFCRKGKN